MSSETWMKWGVAFIVIVVALLIEREVPASWVHSVTFGSGLIVGQLIKLEN